MTMRRLAALGGIWLGAGLAGLGGGCSSGYDVTLEVTDAVNATCNTSCVQSVLVEAFGEIDYESDCIDNITMKSLREHGLSGAVDLPVPEKLAAMVVTGWRGPGCGGDILLFDGGTAVTGSDVKVPMKCVASCSAQGMMQLQTTSLLAVAQGTCAAGDATAASAGVLLKSPVNLVFFDFMETLFFGPPPTQLTSGMASLDRGVIATASPNTCGAVILHNKDGSPTSISCVRYGSAGLCGGAGKTEVAYYASPPLANRTAGYRVVGVFAKKGATAGTTVPYVGATVSLAGAAPASRIEYLMLDATKTSFLVADPPITATNATGAFAVYTEEPAMVTVTATDGTTVSRMVGGGTVYSSNNGNVIDLSGAQLFVPTP
jgi:hypothetical protein